MFKPSIMKKLIYTGKVLTIISLALLTGCKKDSKVEFPKQSSANGTTADFVYRTPTLPTFSDADGVLAAVYAHNYRIVTISPFEKEFEYGMAKFTNTTGNFNSLTDAGSVVLDTTLLVKASDLSYLSTATNYSINISNFAVWNVSGAGTVPAMSYTMSAGIPSHSLFSNTSTSYWNDSWIPTFPKNPALNHSDSSFNTTSFAVIPIKNYVTNADSVIIIFNDGAGFNFTKKTAATDSIMTIAPNEFAGYPAYNASNLTLQINVIKYSNTIVGTKKYYFLRMTSYIKYWSHIY